MGLARRTEPHTHKNNTGHVIIVNPQAYSGLARGPYKKEKKKLAHVYINFFLDSCTFQILV